VDAKKIAAYGSSMGSYWSLRLASYDRRIAAVASAVACFNPNNTIFTQCSPRFKQMFMYMAGYEDEARFDVEVARDMTVRGHLGSIRCPTLLSTGEFDPLCPLEDTIEAYAELTSPKELWIFENQYHQQRRLSNLGGLDNYDYIFDWLGQVFDTGLPAQHRRIAYIRENGDGPWGECDWAPTVRGGQAYF
jgi:dipeptidyl aminopeptidase/acylaminoacyl peptidase